MQFTHVQIGGPGIGFPMSDKQVRGFSFPQPAAQASAVVQGFELSHVDGDIDLGSIAIELITTFSSGDKGGSVEARFHLNDDGGGGIFGSNLITADIRILVIGT